MRRPRSNILLACTVSALWSGAVAESAADGGDVFFEAQVRPILVARCYDCHSEQAGERKGGLWLDRKEGWGIGGDSGAAIVPGDVERSLVVHALRYLDEDLQMPPKAKLDQAEIDTLEKWIAMGAPDPRDEAMAGAVRDAEIDFEAARSSWAFRPHQNPAVPAVRDLAWGVDPVDKFVLAEIEGRGLQPAARAEPAALLRRLHFDLVGLPPTPEEVAAFEEGGDLEKVVDALLARPAFGEKWGRHWLDVARYADSNGGDRNFTYFHAWRYRNYVIDSFNRDRPYYQFVYQQLAGDLMPAADDTERREQLVGASFLALGPKMLTERDKEKLWLDTADEQVDTVGRAFLGLTMGCARCHDHKFDPISQEDYYAMAGIFRSTEVVTGTSNGCVNVAAWVEQALPVEGRGDEEVAAKLARLELAMRLVVEKQFANKTGVAMEGVVAPFAGLVIDDADAEKVGDWKRSSHFPSRFGDAYLHDDREGKGLKSVVFRGPVPEGGVYEVRVAYNSGPARASSVPVSVEDAEGLRHIDLDQTKTPSVGGLFEPVGRYRFDAGGAFTITIGTGGTDGFVIADAVQLIAEGDIEREAEAIAAYEAGTGDPLLRMSEGDVKKVMNKLRGELRKAELAMAPRDATDAGDIHLRVRGEPNRIGAMVERGFPMVLHPGDPPTIPDGQSGRLQLAEWITGDDNALLDRVLVNRVWHHLFGRGIVATVDNFGAIGAEPTHPELLDYLASEFRAGGGSVKGLVRRLVLTETYALSADAPGTLKGADPTNELFARQNRRRLSAEEIRDSVLFLAGRLETATGAATAAKYGDDLDKPFDLKGETLRTIYLPVARNNSVPELSLFDAANPDLVSGSRPTTTVPTQALYLLNGEFFLSRAAEIASMVYGSASTPKEEVAGLYRRVLNRLPAEGELQRALEFVDDLAGGEGSGEGIENAYAHLAHMLLVSTEFLYLD